MKIKLKSVLGRFLMGLSAIKICIVDDEKAYFNENLLKLAHENGFTNIERYFKIDSDLFEDLHSSPRDIVILDIQGVTVPEVAKDGLHVASHLIKHTHTYVVVTSAHQFHLTNQLAHVDYVIEDRLLTAVDFLNELNLIVEDYLYKKTSFYKKIIFRTGYRLAKQGVT